MILRTFAESFPYVQLWYFLPAYKKGPFNSILVGSNERIALDYDHINRKLNGNPAAFSSLVPYGLTSAEAVLPHFVADERTIRPAVKAALINSLDHPHYEFYYPWDYVINRGQQIVTNHNFIRELKLKAHPEFLTSLEPSIQGGTRFNRTLEVEDRYLLGFQKFLSGMSLAESYRIFDEILALAPWNDSLRARIFSQYMHFALNSKNPAERAWLLKRANALYDQHDG